MERRSLVNGLSFNVLIVQFIPNSSWPMKMICARGINVRNERREIKRDGAKAIPNSGRGNKKGDALLDGNLLIDYKHVEKSHTIKKDAWLKHKRDAWNDGQYEPALKIVMGDDGVSLAVIDWEYFLQLREAEWMFNDLG